MRDDVVLRADVYRPAGEGRRPVLLARTCYGKSTWPALIDPAKRTDSRERHQAVAEALADIGRVHRHRPLSEHPVLPRGIAEYYYEWLEHPDHDEYWQRLDVLGRWDEIEIPALHVAGWF